MIHFDEEDYHKAHLHETHIPGHPHHLNLHDIEQWLQAQSHKLYHSVHVAAHCAYFCAVYVEGHGFYAFMGGALFIITIAGIWSGLGGD